MFISVVSPYTRGTGNTVTAMLLGLGLAESNKRVFLSHSSACSDAFSVFFGLAQEDADITATPNQLVQMLLDGALKSESIPDYCRKVSSTLDVFTNQSDTFSDAEMCNLLKFVKNCDYEYKIIDIDGSFDSKNTRDLLTISDLVILNVSQSISALARVKARLKEINKAFKGKTVVLVCNRYAAAVGNDKSIAANLGVATRCLTLNYNSYVIMGCNNGSLASAVFELGKQKDSRVVDVYSDTMKLAESIVRLKLLFGKRGKL